VAGTYTLPYRDAFQNGARPYLILHVTGPGGADGDIVGLIDSGADGTCLPAEYARLMGYAGADLEIRQGTQVGGTMDMWVARKPAVATVPGMPEAIQFELWPSFVQGSQTPLWGRGDFFMTFGVAFDEPAKEFALVVP